MITIANYRELVEVQLRNVNLNIASEMPQDIAVRLFHDNIAEYHRQVMAFESFAF